MSENASALPCWLYFGCGQRAGHYVFEERGHERLSYQARDRFNRFDGVFPPQPERESQLYMATFSVVGGWNMSVLSWWDRSVDSRPASNSTIFAPGVWEPAAMLDEAHRRFPWVFNRLPKPISLYAPDQSKSPSETGE